VIVFEGLDLAGMPDGEYELVCLPLRIVGCDGSPRPRHSPPEIANM